MSPPDAPDQELRDALERLEESVPSVSRPLTGHVRDRSIRAPLATTSVVVAALLVALIARDWLTEWVGQPTPTPIAASEPPSAQPSPSTPTPTIPNLSWVSVPFPGGVITAASASDNAWVALATGEAWLSKDGSFWQEGSIGSVATTPWDPQQTRGLPYPIGAARLGDSWYAVSRLEGGLDAITPVVFVSPDGLLWAHLPSFDWWGNVPTGVASNGSVLIATNAGPLGGQGSVFVSADGIRWTEHLAPGGPATMVDVYANPNAIVTVGYRYSDETLERPVAWVSTDGSTWAEADPIEAARGTTPRAIGQTATGAFVMLATVTTFPAGCADNSCLIHTLAAWYSADGQKWQPAGFPAASAPFGAYREIDLLSISGGVLAVASTEGGTVTWVSSDGTSWKDADLTSPDVAVSAAASDGDSVRLFGASGVVVEGITP